MQAIIPVAGKGTRLRPLTNTIPKVLLNVAGKPCIKFIIDELIRQGINDIIFITGYLGEKVEDYIKKEFPQLKATFVEQKERLGTAHAILQAEPYIKEDVFIIFGDTVFDGKINLETEGDGVIYVTETDDPQRFGIVELEGKYLKRIVEKPKNPPTNLANIGMYYVKDYKLLFEKIHKVIDDDIKPTGEYMLTDAFQFMIEEGTKFEAKTIDKWLDTGKIETTLETNEYLVDKMEQPKGEGIIPPVYIGKNVKIENSIIGPNVVLNDNCEVKNSKLKNIIVDCDSKIEDCDIENSLVGKKSKIKCFKGKTMLGDHCKLEK